MEYCYDCGSENTKALGIEVKEYAEKHSSLDVLFLSHLDFDHVSGLDELLLLTQVETVVLPYLTDFERIYLLAETIAYSHLSSEYLRLLGSPTGWFFERGVKRVILVLGKEDQNGRPETPDDTPSFPPSFPERGRKISYEEMPPPSRKLSLDFERLAQFRDPDTQGSSSAVYRVPDTHVFRLVYEDGNKPAEWGFITHVHPEKEREERFHQLFESKFGISVGPLIKQNYSDINPQIKVIIKDRDLRSRLAECYKEVFKDRNRTSLSLYSGPLAIHTNTLFAYKHTFKNRTPKRIVKHNVCGWLGTGDNDLKLGKRRQHFLHHFHQVLPHVLTLSIPHHGSKRNFHEDIVPQECEYCTVGAGKLNAYHHPHPEVTVALERLGKTLFQTTEEPKTFLVEKMNLWW